MGESQHYLMYTSGISIVYGEKWMSAIMESIGVVNTRSAVYNKWDPGKTGLLLHKQ